MTPELKAAIEKILAEPEKATSAEIYRAITCAQDSKELDGDTIKEILAGKWDHVRRNHECVLRPEFWWPLAMEIKLPIHFMSKPDDEITIDLPVDGVIGMGRIIQGKPGVVVCLVWLTIKLEESR